LRLEIYLWHIETVRELKASNYLHSSPARLKIRRHGYS